MRLQTQQRFNKFGIVHLRDFQVLPLREIIISAPDIEQSPLLEKAQAALIERKNPNPVTNEREAEILQIMKDMALDEVLNPTESPNSVVFADC